MKLIVSRKIPCLALTLLLGHEFAMGDEARVGMIVPNSNSAESTSTAMTPLIRVSLLGSWAKPREAELREDATLWDASLAAGGPTQWPPSMVQVMRKDTLLMQINLAHALARQTTLGSLRLQDGDVLFHGFPPPPPPPPPTPIKTTASAYVKEGLNITIQILAIFSSLLFTYSTYTILHDQGKL